MGQAPIISANAILDPKSNSGLIQYRVHQVIPKSYSALGNDSTLAVSAGPARIRYNSDGKSHIIPKLILLKLTTGVPVYSTLFIPRVTYVSEGAVLNLSSTETSIHIPGKYLVRVPLLEFSLSFSNISYARTTNHKPAPVRLSSEGTIGQITTGLPAVRIAVREFAPPFQLALSTGVPEWLKFFGWSDIWNFKRIGESDYLFLAPGVDLALTTGVPTIISALSRQIAVPAFQLYVSTGVPELVFAGRIRKPSDGVLLTLSVPNPTIFIKEVVPAGLPEVLRLQVGNVGFSYLPNPPIFSGFTSLHTYINTFSQNSNFLYRFSLVNPLNFLLRTELSTDMYDIQKLIFPVMKNDPSQAVSVLLTTMRDSYQSILDIKNTISESSSDILKLKLQLLGDYSQDIQNLQTSLTTETQSFLKIVTTISDSADGRQLLLNIISESAIQELVKLSNNLEEVNISQSIEKMLNILGDPSDFGSMVEFTTWDIYIDGLSIKSNMKNGNIQISEEAVHNTINLTLVGENIFDLCDPSINYALARIEVQIENRALFFLLEERSGSENEFIVWGRSLTALEDVPYKESVSFSLQTNESASSVAETLAGSRALDWEVFDWVLPGDFQYTGTPVDGLQQLAFEIGGVLRSQDDGSFLIRKKFPVRPVDISGHLQIIEYSRFSNMIEMNFKTEIGLPYTSVPVNGISYNTQPPIIEVDEDNSLLIGKDVVVRVYIGDSNTIIDNIFLTAGIYTNIGEKTNVGIVEELLFSAGIAEARFYVDSITSVEWIGISGSEINWEKGSRRLEIADQPARIARVTYNAKYREYVIKSHHVEMLHMILTYSNKKDIAISVNIEDGSKVAPLLERNLLTDAASALEAGTAWIDANVPSTMKLRIKAPYRSNIIDGEVVLISNERIRTEGNAHVTEASILFDGIKIYNELGVTLWPRF